MLFNSQSLVNTEKATYLKAPEFNRVRAPYCKLYNIYQSFAVIGVEAYCD